MHGLDSDRGRCRGGDEDAHLPPVVGGDGEEPTLSVNRREDLASQVVGVLERRERVRHTVDGDVYSLYRVRHGMNARVRRCGWGRGCSGRPHEGHYVADADEPVSRMLAA